MICRQALRQAGMGVTGGDGQKLGTGQAFPDMWDNAQSTFVQLRNIEIEARKFFRGNLRWLLHQGLWATCHMS